MTRTTVGLLAVVTAGLVGLAPTAGASEECEGGVAGPAKPVLHGLEGPVEGTPAESLVHAVECALP